MMMAADERVTGRFIQPEKIYRGWRDETAKRLMGAWPFTFVTVNGHPLRAFNFGEADHFDWGYDGTQPRMLALAVLADYFGETPTDEADMRGWETATSPLKCIRYGKRFLGIIARLEKEASWTISSDHLREWLKMLDQQSAE